MPRVREVEVFHLTLPYGRRPESILVRLTDHGGMTGWGEMVHPSPRHDGAEHGHELRKTWAALEETLAPTLLGVDWEHPDELGVLPGGPAVDMACWDLWGRLNGVPLAHALGGSRTSLIATARLAADRSTEAVIARVNRQVCAGYAHITLDIHPGWDVEPVRAVRKAYPGLVITVDGRGAYRDVEQLVALDAYGVATIERPFAELAPHVELQERVSALVAFEAHSVDELAAAIEAKAGRALLLRPSRFGSLREVRRAHDLAVEAGWQIAAAGGSGTGLARAATVAVGSLPGCTLPAYVAEPPRSAQIVKPPVGPSGGVVAVPLTQPGLGHLVDEDRVRRLATDSFRL
ncbi:enolase C-terminal domain-like protein [Thermopolyspora flexuosa]|jgi:O-succinylbenzoate synthase|uniref:O-succinylbenzoate synthase n=1 Tax=Thermopolyspora flexuosa TaxID=103836 RepID=A0A543IW61_9ACTN|nr:enolase C-terminal domain-like protein [Thermopolyspora flexuosa]TQM74791.1 O-succinylbenzoate synthase [Thermopolyspora flexuosa]